MTTLLRISMTEAQRLMQAQDKILENAPEVERVALEKPLCAGHGEQIRVPLALIGRPRYLLKPILEWRPLKRWYSFLPAYRCKRRSNIFGPNHIGKMIAGRMKW